MIRRAFEIVASLSLLLCVAVAILWVRSHFVADFIEWREYWTRPIGGAQSEYGSREADAASSRGSFYLTYLRSYSIATNPLPRMMQGPQLSVYQRAPMPVRAGVADGYVWDRMGFRLGTREGGLLRPKRHWWLVEWAVPYWAVVIASAILPAVWARAAVRRWRRPKAGRCTSCGYDLRASTGRCPECGEPIAAKVLA